MYEKDIVDCLEITDDKSSESRVCTPDARLTRVIYAKSKRRAQSLHLRFTTAPRRAEWSPCLRFIIAPRRVERSPRLRFTALDKTQSSKSASPPRYRARSPLQCQDVRFEARVSISLQSQDAEPKARVWQSSKLASSKVQSRHPK